MYRTMIARSGKYYVQKMGNYGWKKCSPFFNYLASARDFARNTKGPRVIEYY